MPSALVEALAGAVIVLALVFSFTNGFSDAATIIAMPVASGAIAPGPAALLVGVFEFIGPIFGGTAVATTVASVVDLGGLPATVSLTVLACGIAAGICWILLAWRYGIPSSASHALVGGLIGAVVVGADWNHVRWGFAALVEAGRLGGFAKVIVALVASPLIAGMTGFLLHGAMRLLTRGASFGLNRHLGTAQILTTAVMAFAHGANDAQKSMGVITIALVTAGVVPAFVPPLWVILACAAAMSVGAMSGGWRIVRTIGFKIYRIRHLHAVDMQATSGLVVVMASLLGGPVSTAHVATSAIIGIGASERPKAIRWSRGQQIVKTWLVTIPGTTVVGGALCFLALAVLGR